MREPVQELPTARSESKEALHPHYRHLCRVVHLVTTGLPRHLRVSQGRKDWCSSVGPKSLRFPGMAALLPKSCRSRLPLHCSKAPKVQRRKRQDVI